MTQLMNRDDFRSALEAIKGKSANQSPFSLARANGTLTREHVARWAENHYHYVGPFADYLIHGERGYQIVLEHANTVELQQRCLKICEIGAQMRLLYTTALYHDYVQGRLESSTPELAAA